MEMIMTKLEQLRQIMKEKQIHAYVVCTDDFHGSEYVGEYFKMRQFLSGFTGSAGTLVVLENEAALWTDGRYFLQAAAQLEGSTITLMKMGEPGVPTIEAYLAEKLSSNNIVGFDGRTVTCAFVNKLEEKLSPKQITFAWDTDLGDMVWKERPALSKEPVWELDVQYTGMSREEKLAKVREKMTELGTDLFVLTSLDDIAWLLNLRGNDIRCNPVFLSYMLIGQKDATLFIENSIVADNIKEKLANCHIALKDYDDLYQELKTISDKRTVLLDTSKANYMVKMCIPGSVTIVDCMSPITFMKAVKTPTECENTRLAHVKDGVAVTRFMYWLKHTIGKSEITELGAAKKLEEFRQEQEGYIEPSFEPIMAYGAHGAIVHYSATKDSNATLEPRSFLLSDTGGQYYEGTTDITRTYALGELTDEEKKAYTLVLMGHLNLKASKFLYGIRGMNLDSIAREPLWRYGMNYNHGTGHGVGFLLNVHEGPNSFRWQNPDNIVTSAVLEEGMITSNEPGVYVTDRFGVRLENLIVCKKDIQNEFGQFMGFENLTMVPFDLDAVDTSFMSDREVELLNQYHEEVYQNISPYLEGDEKEWLREATRKVGK